MLLQLVLIRVLRFYQVGLGVCVGVRGVGSVGRGEDHV